MSPSPERVSQVLRMFTPLILGAALVTFGVVQSNAAVIAVGAGLLGVPGLNGTLQAHQAPAPQTPKGGENGGRAGAVKP
jgi:hypothetical protein